MNLRKISLSIASVCAVSLMAHAAKTATTTDVDTAKNTNTTNDPAVANPVTAAALTDAQIVHIVNTANEGEIDAGKTAEKKAENKEVKDFAKMMVDEHKTNEKQSKDIAKKSKIKAKDNDISKTLKRDTKEQIAQLKKLKGNEFDRAYMTSQIAMHERVLDNLETKLIPAAQTPELKSHLEMTKTHVQSHLAKAKDIEISISK